MCDDMIDYNRHEEISSIIKSISLDKIKREWDILTNMTLEELETIGGRSKVGCDIIDYYFFTERLHTTGNKGINFFDFLKDIEYYKKKHYIQTLVTFCENNNRYKDSLIKRYYYIYGLCFGYRRRRWYSSKIRQRGTDTSRSRWEYFRQRYRYV